MREPLECGNLLPLSKLEFNSTFRWPRPSWR